MEVAMLEVGQGSNVTREVAVTEASQVAAVRREALVLAARVGLGERARADLAVLVSEAATNLVKHAREGTCLLRALTRSAAGRTVQRGIEVLCIDRGPGIANIGACLRDGYSTAGSLGTGLGAMQRMSTVFDLYSLPGIGTALLLELWEEGTDEPQPQRLALAAVAVAHRSEEVSGDGWAVAGGPECSTFLLVDGLGHGGAAASASQAAIASFLAAPSRDATEILAGVDAALRSSRGAAAAVLRIDHERGRVEYCGIGNIAGTLFHSDRVQRMVSQSGTLGHGVHKAKRFEYDWTPATTVVLHTDGLTQRWDLARYPGLLQRKKALLAGVLFRDHARLTDDATVLVAGERA